MADHATPVTAAAPAVVAERLHSAAIHLLRAVRRVDTGVGVGPAKLSALSVLVFGGPRSIGALARAEQVRLPTMSRLVRALERDGLATRSADPADGRATRVHATPLGRSVLRRGRTRRVATLARRLEPLPEADRALLARAAELIEGLT